MGGWTNPSIAGGGTITGDLTVTGNLTVQGATTSIVNQTISGTVIIDVDNTEAFLVRKDGDAGDVFVVDTSAGGQVNAYSIKNPLSGGNVDVSEITMVLQHLANVNQGIGLGFGLSAAAGTLGAAIIHEREGANSYGKLHFATKPSGGGADFPIRMTIGDDGKVGFNITAPTSLIHGVETLDDATGDEIAYRLDYTSNKATSGDDTGLLIAMTDTASPGTSRLLDLHVGGATRFFVDLNGLVQFENQVRGANANGPTIRDVAATATTPTLVPNRADITTGIGGISGEMSLITGGVEAIRIDSNQDVGLGIAPVTGCQLLLPQEDDAVTPTLAFGDGDTGFYEGADDELRVSIDGLHRWTWGAHRFLAEDAFGPFLLNEVSSATNVTIGANRGELNTGLGGAIGELSVIITNDEAINISESSNIVETKFDAGDNAAGNVGAWTSVLSAVATLTSVADTKLTAVFLIPAGSHLLGLTARITTSFGTSTGLTDFDVGDGTDLDRWANSLAITAGTTLDLTDATAAFSGDFAAANDVVLTANGGNFDATGVIELIAHYITLTAPTG